MSGSDIVTSVPGEIERGARAIADTAVSTTDTAACWLVLCQHGVNINGHHVKASWFFDRVLASANAIRNAWTMEIAA